MADEPGLAQFGESADLVLERRVKRAPAVQVVEASQDISRHGWRAPRGEVVERRVRRDGEVAATSSPLIAPSAVRGVPRGARTGVAFR